MSSVVLHLSTGCLNSICSVADMLVKGFTETFHWCLWGNGCSVDCAQPSFLICRADVYYLANLWLMSCY